MANLNYEELAETQPSNSNKDCITSSVSGVGAITERVYNMPHTFLDESYDSRHGWYNPTYPNSYLIPHSKEESSNYDIRKSFSTYKNFLKSIICTIVEPLFKNKFEFEITDTNMTFSVAAETFNKKFNIKLFLMESMKDFYLHDLLFTIIEPRTTDTTEINGTIPEIYNIKIDNIISFKQRAYSKEYTEISFKTNKTYVDTKTYKKIPYYTITTYTQTNFVVKTELYTDGKGKYFCPETKGDTENLTRLTMDDKVISGYEYEILPIIEFKAKIDTTIESTPEMHDLAIACWDYYNTNSLYKEIERKATFPMLTIQSNSEVNGLTIGVNNALVYSENMNAPNYLELDTQSHQELRTARSESKQEIYKLFLQGLQTDETKFTSEDSNEISESLFFNKVNFLSEYLIDYTIKLFTNVSYVMLDGKTDTNTIHDLVKKIDMRFNFDFDMNRELSDIQWYNLLSELTMEDEVRKNRLIDRIEEKLQLTDKPQQE